MTHVQDFFRRSLSQATFERKLSSVSLPLEHAVTMGGESQTISLLAPSNLHSSHGFVNITPATMRESLRTKRKQIIPTKFVSSDKITLLHGTMPSVHIT